MTTASAAQTQPPTAQTSLTSEYQGRGLSLRNRLVMAPMTRSRAIGNVPNALMATYYGQRAQEAGLIITEGTAPSPDGLGYARIPGLFNAEQVAGWRLVTDAIHAAGARVFVQLMHTGRVSHQENMPAGARVLAPSAVAWEGSMYVDGKGNLPAPTPEAMSEADIEEAIEAFAGAAARAVEAGFDGVELHGANGYLIEQFLNPASNQRTDKWGGSVEGRARFAVEVAKRASARIGAERVGIRVSPYSTSGGLRSDDGQVEALYVALAGELSALGLAYVHLVDHSAMGQPEVPARLKQALRQTFRGALILSGGYDLARANADLAEGKGDLVAFGRPFIANPKLLTRLTQGLPLAAPDFSTLYTPGEVGYTDYPLAP